jgi:Ca2+-dependent lipid-binding protein
MKRSPYFLYCCTIGSSHFFTGHLGDAPDCDLAKMSLLDIMRGLIFAFSSCLLASAYFTFVFKVKPFLLQRDPKKLRPKPVGMDVIAEILDADEASRERGETCDWLNVGLKWVFVDLFPIPRVRASIEAVIQEMLQGFKRGSTGYFVRQVELLDLDYGQQPPMMLHPRVITKPATHNGIVREH